MYNFIEYSSNYSKTGSLWFYSKDETTNFDADIANIVIIIIIIILNLLNTRLSYKETLKMERMEF